MADKKGNVDRRDFVRKGLWGVCLAGLGAGAAALTSKGDKRNLAWQIDPEKCVQCGNCATHCVLVESAAKCVHLFAICGYCDLCSGYLVPDGRLDTGAENEVCPTGAISRTFVEDPYFEYKIDEKLCNGCAKCVKGCGAFGNGSLFMQVRHDRCLNCNECSIAAACPSQAFKRVPIESPYLLKGDQHD